MQLQLVLDDVLACLLFVVFLVVVIVVAVAAPVLNFSAVFKAHFPSLTFCVRRDYFVSAKNLFDYTFPHSFLNDVIFGIRFAGFSYQSRCFNGCQSFLAYADRVWG